MAPSLSSKQAEELHKSIIAYLTANNLPTAAATLRTELNLGEDVFDANTAQKYEALLQKKWTSVVRLQKKIMDLEARNQTLQSEVDNATPTSLSERNDPASWLPKQAPRYTLDSHRDGINCIAFHPIFSSIASGSEDYTIKIWDWELGELEKTIKGHTRAVLDVDYGGPKGGYILASCSSDMTIKLWDPADDYKNIRTLSGHDHSVSAVRFIPSGVTGAASGNLLVSASRDTTLMIWDVAMGYCVRTLRGHSAWVRDVCPSPDGRFLLSTGDDMTVRLWDISGPDPDTKLTMFGHEHYVECCALAPPSSYQYLAAIAGQKKDLSAVGTAEFIATGSRDKTIKLWDSRGTCVATLAGHDNWVRAILFHPSGKYLLSASDDKTIRCWDLSQGGKCVKVLGDVHERFITCLKWAPGMEKDGNSGSTEVRNAVVDSIGLLSKRNDTNGTSHSVQIRCIIATGGVDRKLRIFAD